MQMPDKQDLHNKFAPYWALLLIALCLTGLSTGVFDFGSFWSGYVLDMTGPAWNYILFRGLFRKRVDNSWTRFFTPTNTYFIFVFVCFVVENMQYLNLYDSTYDSWDFAAYISLLTPIFLLDLLQSTLSDTKSNEL